MSHRHFKQCHKRMKSQAKSGKNIELLLRLGGYLKGYWKVFTAGALCTGMASLLTLAVAPLLGRCVDAVNAQNYPVVRQVAYLVILLYAVKGVFAYGQAYLIASAVQGLSVKLRKDIFAHVQRMPLSYFHKTKTGDLLSRIMNDVNLLQSGTASVIEVISCPLTMLGGLIYMFYLSWQLSLISLVFVAFMGFAIARDSKRMKSLQISLQSKLSDVSANFEETVSGIRVVKCFGMEDHEINSFGIRNDLTLAAALKNIRRSALVSPAVELIGAAGIAGVLVIGVAGLNLQFGDLTKFLFLCNAVTVSAKHLGRLNVVYQQTLAGLERIFEVLDEQADLQESPDAIELPPGPGRVEFRNVSFGYGDDDFALKNISFTMEPGEVVALVGQSGAGKTTIANLIPRFYDVKSGSVIVDGEDVRNVTLKSLRERIGIVPQETILFSGSIRDNIAYGKIDATDDEIIAAAKTANADDFIRSLENGYETIVGERGARLSGGEKQRISIARALLKNPRILILDEATSSLDAKSESAVQRALDELITSRTTLIIAHRLSTITRADKILVLEDGKIAEMGTFRELLDAGGLFSKLYHAQFQLQETG